MKAIFHLFTVVIFCAVLASDVPNFDQSSRMDYKAVRNNSVLLVNSKFDSPPVVLDLICNGVLISPDTVATARHCVDDRQARDISILRGSDKLCSRSALFESRSIQSIHISESIDYAEIKLDGEYLGEFVPIHSPKTDSSVFSVGYGSGDLEIAGVCQLLIKELDYLPSVKCRSFLTNEIHWDGRYGCTIPKEPSYVNTCVGDSGGGVYSAYRDGLYLVGITTGGYGCGSRSIGYFVELVPSVGLLD